MDWGRVRSQISEIEKLKGEGGENKESESIGTTEDQHSAPTTELVSTADTTNNNNNSNDTIQTILVPSTDISEEKPNDTDATKDNTNDTDTATVTTTTSSDTATPTSTDTESSPSSAGISLAKRIPFLKKDSKAIWQKSLQQMKQTKAIPEKTEEELAREQQEQLALMENPAYFIEVGLLYNIYIRI